MLKRTLPICVLLLSSNLVAFADTCPSTDPAIGSSHSAFTQATLVSGVLPQYPNYKGGIVCSYLANKQGNVYPYKSVPIPVNPSNWVGPTHYGPLLLTACINADPQACAYNVAEQAE